MMADFRIPQKERPISWEPSGRIDDMELFGFLSQFSFAFNSMRVDVKVIPNFQLDNTVHFGPKSNLTNYSDWQVPE